MQELTNTAMERAIESGEKINPIESANKKNNGNDIGDTADNLIYDDTTIAIRFVQYLKEKAFYHYEKKKWNIYDGKRYAEDKHNIITNMFEEFLDNEAKYIIDNYSIKSKHTMLFENNKYRNHNRKQAALSQSIRKEIIKTNDEIDSHISLFNVENCIIKLLPDGNYEIIQHSPKYLITQLANTEYDKNAPPPSKWLEFIQLITLGDPEVAEYLQKYLGYCLTGSVSEQIFVFLFGSGNNGKSTLTRALKMILGDYVANVNFTSFTRDRNNGGASSDLARLNNKRLVIPDESINNDGRRKSAPAIIDSRIIKTITGGDTMIVRNMYESEFEMQPTFKVILFGNNPIEFNDFSVGMQRRARQIPLLYKFNNPRDMDEILAEFQQEAQGIFNWLLEGYKKWRTDKLETPTRIKEATNEMFLSQNNILRFISDCCNSAGSTLGQELYKAYKNYCEEKEISGFEIKGQRNFYSQLESFGYIKRSAKQIYFENIILK